MVIRFIFTKLQKMGQFSLPHALIRNNLSANQLQKLVAGFVAFEENAREGRCSGDGVGFLHTAHGHAGVHGFDDHGDTQRVQGLLDAITDLLGEAFLYLQPAGVGFHYAGDFAEAGYFSLGNVGDMRLADERKHVVLAQGEQFDVLYDDHVVVRFLEKGAFDEGLSVLEIPLGKELHGLRYPFRRLLQAFARGVFPEQAQNGLNVRCDFLRGLFIVFFYFFVRHGLFFVADVLRIRLQK